MLLSLDFYAHLSNQTACISCRAWCKPELPESCRDKLRVSSSPAIWSEFWGGRTAVHQSPATITINGNTGHWTIESKQGLRPLEVRIDEGERTTRLYGNILSVTAPCQSFSELDELIQAVYYAFPMLLNLEFADPPVVTDVTGEVDGTSFRWELERSVSASILCTSQDLQEKKVIDSWLRFNIISDPVRRRLVAAIHYFYTACRLARSGHTPWEFMSESILNFCKTLEVLFPYGEGGTCNAVREGLERFGYTQDQIERDFIPALLLRNQIDVGHVFLATLRQDQLNVIHTYSESAEETFREMFRKIIESMQEGRFEAPPYQVSPAGSDIEKTISMMAKRQERSPLRSSQEPGNA